MVKALQEGSYDRRTAIECCKGFNRAELALHVGAEGEERRIDDVMRCYLTDEEAEFKVGVFDFIKEELLRNFGGGDEALREVVVSFLGELVAADVGRSVGLVADFMSDDLSVIIRHLSEEPILLYRFLSGVIVGADDGGLLGRLTAVDKQLFIEMMCEFER